MKGDKNITETLKFLSNLSVSTSTLIETLKFLSDLSVSISAFIETSKSLLDLSVGVSALEQKNTMSKNNFMKRRYSCTAKTNAT